MRSGRVRVDDSTGSDLVRGLIRKKLAKSLSARGHALPYNGGQNLIVAGRYKDGKGPALLWVGALKSREEDDVVEFLQEIAFELGLLVCSTSSVKSWRNAESAEGKEGSAFSCQERRGTSPRGVEPKHDAFEGGGFRHACFPQCESDASELGAEHQVLAACGTNLHREHELETL